MLTKDIEKDLQHYIDEHIKMQFFCYNLSSAADKLGFPGFSHYFQVQAQDEVLHQRRIMNFVLDRDGHYQIKNIAEEYKDIKNIIELMETYQTKRAYFAELTNKLAQHANNVGDLVTYKFYDWFIIDFYEELAEVKDIIEWIKMSNNNYYEIDRKMGTKKEPDTLTVINPFSPHA
ncbi:ferritin [Spiroplasma citri]|uniref:Ferritin n=1 Tax=Spiroplasma citri TaxID=2133 RepID=A0AAJ4EII4_SPICI|nr:ferritin [Spiroplasma citri]APE74376.1 putative ferritin [Spiroplasma citri]QED24322.1 ferritin [Spiroplasma citri]QIA67943.1 ferritin [Spiroplasma citri]QIA68470.1 ferritin [Spiroplasma citri]QIA70345.1 ferritin [Spiroplasma citri]